jgi:hypothetical protein
MKTYWESGGIAPRILDLALVGGEWSDSRPGRFTPRAVLDAVAKRIIPSSLREPNPRNPIVQPIASSYTDYMKMYGFIYFNL